MIRFLQDRQTLLGGILAALVAVFAYANTLSNGFVWSDETLIVEGKGILQSSRDFDRAITGTLWPPTPEASRIGGGSYRPVEAISLTIDHAFHKKSPAGYHATNVLLHGAATLLLFLLLGRLFRGSRVALLASLLFAAHPVHTEAVAWVSARGGLLAALFGILSLYLLARAGERREFLPASLAAFALALGANESAVVLPLLALLVRHHLRRPGERVFAWGREGLFFAVLFAYLAIRWLALGRLGTGIERTINPALLFPTVVRVIGEYVRLLFLPFPLHTNDAVRISTIPLDAPAFLALVFLAAMVYGFLRLGKERPEVRFGLLFFGITLIPLLNIFPLHHFRAERALYLPSAGFLIAAAALLDRWGARIVGRGRRWGLEPGEFVTAGLVLVLAFGTVARNRTWRSDFSLFSDTLRKNRYAPEAAYCMGKDGYRKGAYPDAVHLFRAALAPDPAYAAFVPVSWVLADAGLAYYKLKDYMNAEGAFREAIRLYPPMEEARFGLALVASAQGRHEEALAFYREILGKNPAHEDARYNLALQLESLDSLARAEEEYRTLIDIDPLRKDAHLNLGSILARTSRFEEALRSYQNALRIAPTDPKIHFNIGLLFAAVGEKKGASEALRTTLELDSSFVEARQILDELTRLDSSAATAPPPSHAPTPTP